LNISFNWKALIGKTKTRSQMCEISTEDGRSEDKEIPVYRGNLRDEALGFAGLISSENQVQDEDTGLWYQLYYERSTIPLDIIKKIDVDDYKKLLEEIFKNSWMEDLRVLDREAAKNKILGWVALMLGSTVCLGALVLALNVIGKK